MAASETTTACPTEEDLAAFLDGMLPEPERVRITAHLADCEDCYEIFAGAVHFLQDSAPAETADSAGRIVPFPVPQGGGGAARAALRAALKGWGIPTAAAAVLVLGVGWAGYRLYFAEIMAPELVASLHTQADLASHLHRFTTYRGAGDEDAESLLSRQPSFLVGARLVDLQISLGTGRTAEAAELLRGIGQSIRSAPFGDKDENAGHYLDAADQLKAGGPEALKKIKAAAPQWEAGLAESALDPQFLTFGKWTEAGRLAADTASVDFFSLRNRHFLTNIARSLEEEQKARGQESSSLDDFNADAARDEAALAELRGIAALWDRGDLQAEDYKKLAKHFETILQRYDT